MGKLPVKICGTSERRDALLLIVETRERHFWWNGTEANSDQAEEVRGSIESSVNNSES